MVKSVVLNCEKCGKRFLSTGETKCIMCSMERSHLMLMRLATELMPGYLEKEDK